MSEFFQLGFLTVSWLDLLDVVIVATLFWFVYRSLRDTLALQVLFLLALLLLLNFVTDAFGLQTVSWILRRLGYGVFFCCLPGFESFDCSYDPAQQR
jgi:DNA integrity scanning protein DisA with diadenylate cyclase activity